MVVRTLFRMIWVVTALLVAIAVALTVLFALGAVWVGTELKEAAPNDPLLRDGAPIFGIVMFAGTVGPALTALPALVAAVAGEVLRIRSWMYYVLAGSGTFVTGGTMTQPSEAPADGTTVKVLVGPSTNGTGITGGQSRKISPGDIIIVPPGVAHWFSAIEQDLDYLVFRVDADHVLPAGYVHPLLKQ